MRSKVEKRNEFKAFLKFKNVYSGWQHPLFQQTVPIQILSFQLKTSETDFIVLILFHSLSHPNHFDPYHSLLLKLAFMINWNTYNHFYHHYPNLPIFKLLYAQSLSLKSVFKRLDPHEQLVVSWNLILWLHSIVEVYPGHSAVCIHLDPLTLHIFSPESLLTVLFQVKNDLIPPVV